MSVPSPSDPIWSLTVAGRSYSLGAATPIFRELDLEGGGLGLFGAPPASASALQIGDFTARVAEGAPVNVSTLRLTPHCNGTHTESARHLDDRAPSVGDILPVAPVPALLVTADPVQPGDAESESPAWAEPEDRLITTHVLERALLNVPHEFCRALVVRTGTDVHAGNNPPYLTPSAAALIRSLGVEHLLVDLPSVDRMEDGGRLAAHRAFWNLQSPLLERRTITELVMVPTSLPDGAYALALHAARMQTDAVPSSPILFALQETTLP